MTGRRRAIALLAILAATVFGCLLGSSQSAGAMTIRGDHRWLEQPACPEGWQQPEYDDSAWQRVAFPWMHVWPRDWPPDPEARPFWGRQKSIHNCVRRSFELDEPPDGGAQLHIWVDDDYVLYLNGRQVGESKDFAAHLPGETYDVTADLRQGRNVIAIELFDAGGVMAALFSLTIPGAADEAMPLAERMRRRKPWASAGFVVLILGLYAAIVRKLGRALCDTVSRTGGAKLAIGVTAVAVAATATLLSMEVYSGHREIPLLEWHALPLALLAALTAALVIGGRALPFGDDRSRPGRSALAVFGILAIALAFRTLWIDSIPVGFFQDEATNGNDAVLVGMLDKVQIWSNSLGGRPTLFLHLMSRVFAVFGESYLTLKIAPVLLGTLTVLAVYAFARIGFGPNVALWAAFLLAVSRWHVHYSRMAWEAICLPLFAATGFALLLHALSARRFERTAIVAAAAVLSAGLYTYAAYRAVPAVAVVFLGVSLCSADRGRLLQSWSAYAAAALVAIVIAFPLARFAWLNPEIYWWRYNEVSLTSFMTYFGTPTPWLHQIGRSALSLNSVGDEIVRHNLPWSPHLDGITGTLFLIGTAVGVWHWRARATRMLLIWFFVYLALASLTRDGPHATRLIGLLPPVVILAAIGIRALTEAVRSSLSPLVLRALGIALAISLLSLNAYEYFVLEANHPRADQSLNALGRSSCEYMRKVDGVRLYWSEDVAFFSDPQCIFLARGRYGIPQPISPEQVLPGNDFDANGPETIVMLGKEFFDLNRERVQPDAEQPPLVDLPATPIEVRDRQDVLLYRLYHFGKGNLPDE